MAKKNHRKRRNQKPAGQSDAKTDKVMVEIKPAEKTHWLDRNRVLVILTACILMTYLVGNYFSSHQLGVSRDAARNDQRPWIAVKAFSVSRFEVGEPLNIGVIVSNPGKTPAVTPDSASSLLIKPANAPLTFADLCSIKRTSKADLSPGVENTLMLTSENDSLDQVTKDEIMAGHKTVVLYGFITYRDVNADNHHTDFCGQLEPSKGQMRFSSCYFKSKCADTGEY
ncbi:MAG: hypothetical protein WCE73_06390 [Candidatus Angelobacter sp.]